LTAAGWDNFSTHNQASPSVKFNDVLLSERGHHRIAVENLERRSQPYGTARAAISFTSVNEPAAHSRSGIQDPERVVINPAKGEMISILPHGDHCRENGCHPTSNFPTFRDNAKDWRSFWNAEIASAANSYIGHYSHQSKLA
jgi:hypothetical protein